MIYYCVSPEGISCKPVSYTHLLRKYRRHAIVVIVIAAAIITPTGDPFTLSVVAIPLYLLYEMSILMIKDKKKTEEEIEDESARSEE